MALLIRARPPSRCWFRPSLCLAVSVRVNLHLVSAAEPILLISLSFGCELQSRADLSSRTRA